MDSGVVSVPSSFIRPPHLRPSLSDQISAHDYIEIPIIDLSELVSGIRPLPIIHNIGRACQEWGFFQVTNHGVPQEIVDGMRAACRNFFGQPAAERNRFRSQNFEAPVAYATSFNPHLEKARDWKDVFYVRDLPGKCNGFDEAPEICKKAFQAYREEVQKLANLIYRAIFESLGLSSDYLDKELTGIHRLIMAVNYYPPCPDPSLTFGLTGHSDISSLTVLLQDEVPGLQVRKGDKWIGVKPLANAFVINVADQIQILSNGIYKSVEHRVVTNMDKPRMSVACFFGPREEIKIAPLSKLVTESHPALYKEVVFGDYAKNFYSQELLADRATLQFAVRE